MTLCEPFGRFSSSLYPFQVLSSLFGSVLYGKSIGDGIGLSGLPKSVWAKLNLAKSDSEGGFVFVVLSRIP